MFKYLNELRLQKANRPYSSKRHVSQPLSVLPCKFAEDMAYALCSLVLPGLIERCTFRTTHPALLTASYHINPCSVQMFGDAIRKLLPAHREVKQQFTVIQRSSMCRNR
jgi:hypothetical protein